MALFKILVKGYARLVGRNSYVASPNTVLIQDSGKNVLVDPGANARRLKSSLARHRIKKSDVDLIFLTHYHPDHILNIRLFPDTLLCDGYSIYHGDRAEAHASRYLPGTHIEIIRTPGHSPGHSSLLFQTDSGRYAVAGDVFSWYDDQIPNYDLPSLIALPDPFAQDMDALKTTRRYLLEIADWIIPGHGRPFPSPLRYTPGPG
ncbi:MAG: MBL fold metallo-hydrolase, partial [Dehalococcoidia bacterium]|nr:MBL fold metallo-hydrolase [Dehalococcoidia bacterium]